MELGLGTVQFGLDYGISNRAGKVSLEQVHAILECAHERGICVLDTAAAYGASEQAIGCSLEQGWRFRIVTKLPPLNKDTVAGEDIAALDASFRQSLNRLRSTRVAGILMHNPGDLFVPGGDAVYCLLQSLKESGAAGKIGISVYTANEIDRLFYHYDFDIVQLPLNVFDQRLLKSGHVAHLKRKGVEIHVRSVFLQGLLLMPVENVAPYFTPIIPTLRRFNDFCMANHLTRCEGAIGFLRGQEDIDVVLTGVTSVPEFIENFDAFDREVPGEPDFSEFAVDMDAMINPRRWKGY